MDGAMQLMPLEPSVTALQSHLSKRSIVRDAKGFSQSKFAVLEPEGWKLPKVAHGNAGIGSLGIH